jgi:hypothetical protein
VIVVACADAEPTLEIATYHQILIAMFVLVNDRLR